MIFSGADTVLKSDGRYCAVPVTYRVTLGEIVSLLHKFDDQRKTLVMPEIPNGSFAKKAIQHVSFISSEGKNPRLSLKSKFGTRADSFTELLKTENCGQFSVNVSLPGITKGEHWHNSKWEQFIVVLGKGLIRERK